MANTALPWPFSKGIQRVNCYKGHAHEKDQWQVQHIETARVIKQCTHIHTHKHTCICIKVILENQARGGF